MVSPVPPGRNQHDGKHDPWRPTEPAHPRRYISQTGRQEGRHHKLRGEKPRGRRGGRGRETPHSQLPDQDAKTLSPEQLRGNSPTAWTRNTERPAQHEHSI